MLRAAIYTISVGVLMASAANADVYKYTDEKGNVQYTDRPLKLPAQRLNIQSQRTDVVELEERTDNEATALAGRDKERQQAAKAKADEKNSAATAAEGKAEACNKARQDYITRMNAQRLYETDDQGERRYLNDDQLDASRTASKQAMDTLCN